APAAGTGLEISFRPDPTLFDGQFANNGWLQELPKPVTKLTWDNAAFVGPQTAAKLGLSIRAAATGGEHRHAVVACVELTYQGRQLRAPAWIVPGHAEAAVTVYFGHGRERAGRVGDGTGFNAYLLRTSTAPAFDSGLEVKRAGGRYTLACTQMHQ